MKRENVINIVNFVRGADNRVAPSVLLETYRKQLALCRESGMASTFLFQYDAMVQPAYIDCLGEIPDQKRELGVWIEFCRGLIEKCGLEWHGRPGFEWDWHVDPDMTMAYSVQARKKLLDEIMNYFHGLFGYYPKSVGSWLLDSVSIAYLEEKYHVDAICICKEQYGTDGYTLWGGYYNQGYYPSKLNSLSPAQTPNAQIQVPVFRMLGVDPIEQYYSGLGEDFNFSDCQHVYTLEPAWKCGQSARWVDWFLNCCFEEEALTFGYAQAGQENSFTWEMFGEGLVMQMEKIRKGYLSGKWKVETMGETGRNFKKRYAITPATALTALNSPDDSDQQSVWYDCKGYRINWYRKGNLVGVRDWFLFDENYCERYLETQSVGNCASYDTLPMLDGYRWGGKGIRSFAQLVYADGQEPKEAMITDARRDGDSVLNIHMTADENTVICRCMEEGVSMSLPDTMRLQVRYLNTVDTEVTVQAEKIAYRHNGKEYCLKVGGMITKMQDGFCISPRKGKIDFSFVRS